MLQNSWQGSKWFKKIDVSINVINVNNKHTEKLHPGENLISIHLFLFWFTNSFLSESNQKTWKKDFKKREQRKQIKEKNAVHHWVMKDFYSRLQPSSGSPYMLSGHSLHVRPPKFGLHWHCPVTCKTQHLTIWQIIYNHLLTQTTI